MWDNSETDGIGQRMSPSTVAIRTSHEFDEPLVEYNEAVPKKEKKKKSDLRLKPPRVPRRAGIATRRASTGPTKMRSVLGTYGSVQG